MTVRIIDVETTGTDPAVDKVIEIASVDLTREFGITNEREVLIDPGIPIPAISSAVHHLIDEDVVGREPFEQAVECFRGADVYVAHNAAFEQAFIDEALGSPRWVCTFKCALRIWPDLPSHSNQFLRYYLGLARPFGMPRTEVAPHRALSDVIVTAAVLVKMMKQATWGQLITWSRDPALYTVLNFGKHKGQRYDAVPADYLGWLIDKSDMDEAVKHSANHWLQQRRRAA